MHPPVKIPTAVSGNKTQLQKGSPVTDLFWLAIAQLISSSVRLSKGLEGDVTGTWFPPTLNKPVTSDGVK